MSSVIKSIETKNKKVYIQLKSKWYRYNLPDTILDGLLSAKSKGSFWNKK